ncbi:MAG: LptA/OstA family protein [Terriglobales bacterium]
MAAPTANPYTRRVRWLVRLRRTVAAALVAGTGVVIALYLLRRRHAPAPQAPVLGIQVQQSAAGVDVSKSVNGRPVFRIFAASADKLRLGGLDELRQVRILVYDQQGQHADAITGNSFRYDEASGSLYADGDVHIQLEDQIQVTAHGLRYNVKQGTGTIAAGVKFALGSAAGSAGAAALNSRTGVADFSGGVELQWARPGQGALDLQSQQAELRRQAGGVVQVELQGEARLRQGSESLAADRLLAQVTPGHTLRHLDAFGHVEADQRSAADALQVRAQAAHADFNPAGQQIESLVLAGRVDAMQTAGAPGATIARRLQAGQLALHFAAGDALRSLVASQGAVLTASGAAAGVLAAPEIDFSFGPGGGAAGVAALSAIATRGRTRLERGPSLQAQADAVQIFLRADQQPRWAVARGQVQVREQAAGGERRSECQVLAIQFAAGANARPALVRESGGVRLQQGERSARAQQLVYTPAQDRAVLSGAVVVSDPQARLTAASAAWVGRPNGSATLSAVAADDGNGRALTVSLLPGAGVALPAAAGTPAASRPVVITAQRLSWAQPAGAGGPGGFRGRAVFTGAVRLLQAPDLLRADQLTISAESGTQAAHLQASGHVQTEFLNTGEVHAAGRAPLTRGAAVQAVRVLAQTLNYSQPQQLARYSGGVRMQVNDATLSAPELTLYFGGAAKTAALQRAVASGGVSVVQPGRHASAQQLSFDFVRNRLELTGGPPSIFDAEHGKISGDPLTFSLASDEIQVGGKHGTRAFGQTHGHK